MPAPSTLAGYGDIDSTFPERIMKMAEKDQDTRAKLMQQSCMAENFSVVFATIVTVGFPWIVCIIALFTHRDVTAYISVFAALLLSGASVIRAIRSNKKEESNTNSTDEDA